MSENAAIALANVAKMRVRAPWHDRSSFGRIKVIATEHDVCKKLDSLSRIANGRECFGTKQRKKFNNKKSKKDAG